jgi:hypothetical protein
MLRDRANLWWSISTSLGDTPGVGEKLSGFRLDGDAALVVTGCFGHGQEWAPSRIQFRSPEERQSLDGGIHAEVKPLRKIFEQHFAMGANVNRRIYRSCRYQRISVGRQ